jgi:hypothetical protein
MAVRFAVNPENIVGLLVDVSRKEHSYIRFRKYGVFGPSIFIVFAGSFVQHVLLKSILWRRTSPRHIVKLIKKLKIMVLVALFAFR